MATAEELLAMETGDAVLTINVETRTITIPAGIKNIGVESDDDVLTLPFSMPRYYGEIDLSEFDIRVNYLNAKKEGDAYIVSDPVVNDDTIEFEWKVGRHATAYKGIVTFNVCLKKITDDVVSQEFNTTVCTLSVLEGLETEEAVVQEYPDVLNQLLSDALYIAKHSGDFDGADGYTPVKGVDYFTDAEVEEIITKEIKTITSFGEMEPNNVYKISTNLAQIVSLSREQSIFTQSQILVYLNTTTAISIEWGDVAFVNDEIPTIGIGNYRIIFEYNPIMQRWVAGVIQDGMVS